MDKAKIPICKFVDGASGAVSFDPTTGDRSLSSVSFVLHNWVASGSAVEETLVATFSEAAGLAFTGAKGKWGLTCTLLIQM